MKYGYYFGPSGSGKTYKLMSDLIQKSMDEPEREFLLIVPDQYTMQTQKDIVDMHPKHGIMNIDVLSFGRLFHKLQAEVGESNSTILDDTGKNLILRRVVQEISDKLPVIGSSVNKTGFIHEIKSVISELMQYGYTPDEVDELIEKASGRKALSGKLKDIQTIYRAFNEYRAGNYSTSEETLSVLATAIRESEYIKNSVVIFDGFTGFTPVQLDVVLALLECCEEVWFSFSLDKEALGESYDGELFTLTKKSIAAIERISKGATRLKDVWLDSVGIRFENEALKKLERNVFRKNCGKYEEKTEYIKMSFQENPRDELLYACKQIKELVTREKICYRDIAIVTGDLEGYSLYAHECFGMFDIPYFVDNAHAVSANPFIDFVRGIMEILKKDFSYDSIMQMLRSGFCGISEEDIDYFDNYLTATDVRGYSRYKSDFRRIPAYMKARDYETEKKYVTAEGLEQLAKVNSVREKVMQILKPLTEYKSGKHKVSELTSQLYKCIADSKAYEKICKYVEYFEENKDYDRKKQYEQLYKSVINLLEQLYSLLFDEEINISDYIELFEAGIDEIRIHSLPQEMDYVILGDIERSRLNKIKALFFIGLNDGIIPAKVNKGGIISDIDREYLVSTGEADIAPSPRQKMYSQRLYLYMNMTKPSKWLYLSYSGAGADGKSRRPSYLVGHIKNIFNNIEITNGREKINQITCNENAWKQYAEDLRIFRTGLKKTSPEFEILHRYCNEDDSKRQEKLIDAAFFAYESEKLSKDLVHRIYGKFFNGNVSRLETFAACQYAHMLKHGIKLAEREVPDIERYDSGNLFHDVLKSCGKLIADEETTWAEISDELLEQFLEDSFSDEANKYEDGKFLQKNINKYELGGLKRILKRTVFTIKNQFKNGKFDTYAFEHIFNDVLDLEDAADGERAKITGRIDRIDICENDGDMFVRVVDYKSSTTKKIEAGEFYDGTSIQLMVYLNEAIKEVAEKFGVKNIIPSGMYYYHLDDPVIEDTGKMTYPEGISEEDKKKLLLENVNGQIQNKLKLEGLTLKNEKVAELSGAVDGTSDGKSSIINHLERKDGELKDNDYVVDSHSMDVILKHTDKITGRLTKGIFDGNCAVLPVGDKACEYCSFKDVCGFDYRLPGYKKKQSSKMSINELVKILDQKEDEVKEEGGDQ